MAADGNGKAANGGSAPAAPSVSHAASAATGKSKFCIVRDATLTLPPSPVP